MRLLHLFSAAFLLVPLLTNAAPRDKSCTSDSELVQWLVQGDFERADSKISAAISDYDQGRVTDMYVIDLFEQIDEVDRPCVEGTISQWVKSKPQSYAAAVANGSHLLRHAWKARGNGFASTVNDAQWERMKAYAKEAQSELDRSLKLHPRPIFSYERLIEIAHLAGKDGDPERLLATANKIAPHNIVARRIYIKFATPRWNGSYAKMWSVVEAMQATDAPRYNKDCVERTFLRSWYHDANRTDEETVQSHQRIVDGTCSKPRDHYTRASALWRLNRFQEALKDFDRAAELEKSPDDKGFYIYWRGRARQQLGQIEAALADYEVAEKLGHTQGMVALGWMYRWGNKQVPQDLRKSYEICERASRTDKTGEALRCVASFHMDGLVVKQDTKRAIAMLVKSANMGDSLSMLSYGDMLWDGHDVKQDRPGAIRWWCKGARDGATEGNERLAENLGFDAKSASNWTCEEMAEFFATPEIVKAAKNPRWYVGRAWERLKARFQ